MNEDDIELIDNNPILEKYERYSAYDVKGMEFKNVILFLNGYDLSKVNDKKFVYMLISRALENFVSIGAITRTNRGVLSNLFMSNKSN